MTINILHGFETVLIVIMGCIVIGAAAAIMWLFSIILDVLIRSDNAGYLLIPIVLVIAFIVGCFL